MRCKQFLTLSAATLILAAALTGCGASSSTASSAAASEAASSAASSVAATSEAASEAAATLPDGVYTADPRKDPDARLYEDVSFKEALDNDLKVMDATALSLCRENRIPIIVFNLNRTGNIRRAVLGEKIGTFVGGE